MYQHIKFKNRDGWVSVKILQAPSVLNKIWNEQDNPENLKLGVVVNFAKKGELAPICKNWRGITLLTTVRKMLGKSILQRMKDGLGDRRLWNEQAPDFVRR